MSSVSFHWVVFFMAVKLWNCYVDQEDKTKRMGVANCPFRELDRSRIRGTRLIKGKRSMK